jgi:hypothetical protein
MTDGSAFPIFLKAELDDSAGAFAEFKQRVSNASGEAVASFTRDFKQIGEVIGNALGKGVGPGKLDLDVGQFRQAAAQAKLFAVAMQETERAAQKLARETGDNSAETRQFINAMGMSARTMGAAHREAEALATTYGRLQREIRNSADASGDLARAQREVMQAQYADAARAEKFQNAINRQVAPGLSLNRAHHPENGATYGELARLARAADEYDRQLAELRQQLDPLAIAQARVNQELEFANQAFRKGDITAAQLETRTQQLNGAMTRLQGGFRGNRQAMIMTGQQLQDITISMVSGQRAGTVLAQQLPQLALAMSTFGGRVGAVATVLSGPWGVALAAGSFLLGNLVDSLRESESATDNARKANYNFTKALNFNRMSVLEYRDAIDQLNEATKRYIDLQAIQLDGEFLNAKKAVTLAEKKLSAADRAIQIGGPAGDIARMYRPGIVEELDKARKSLSDTTIGLQKRAIEETIDRAQGVQGALERQLARLEANRSDSQSAEYLQGPARGYAIHQLGDRYVSKSDFDRQYTDLRRRIDANRDANRNQGSTTSRDARVGDMTALLQQLIPGVRITSTTGGRHAKGSDHYAGRAIDFVVPGMMNAAGTAEIRRMLEEAGVEIRRNARGTEQFFGPGRGAKTPNDHADHFHLAWKGSPSPESAQRAAERAARAQEQLNRLLDESSETVLRMREQFDRAPRDIDRAEAAVRKLNDEIAQADAQLKAGGLTDEQRAVVEATKARAEDTRASVIPDYLRRPMTNELGSLEREIEMQDLLLQSRQAQHDSMRDAYDLARLLGAESLDELGTQLHKRKISEAEVDAYFDKLNLLRLQNIELERQRERQQVLLGVVEDVESAARGAIADVFDGKGVAAAGNLMKSVFAAHKRAMAEDLFTSIFGDAFKNQKLQILGLDQVDESGREAAKAMARAAAANDNLASNADNAAKALRGLADAANDNSGTPGVPGTTGTVTTVNLSAESQEIVVTGQKTAQKQMKESVEVLGKKVFKDSWEGISEKFGKAMRGAAIGEAVSGTLKSLGIKQSKTGAQIGGAIGSFLKKIPGGEIIGSVIGGTIGGLFKKTPKGSATITGADSDAVYAGSGSLRGAVTGLASGVQSSLNRIADALNADLGSFAVSIGQRKKNFVVDPTGSGRTKGSGVLSFKSEEEAIAAALRDAIRDGALRGIREGAQRLVSQGQDIEAQLQKAVDFQSVFDRLKAYDDPIGAALDGLDREFQRYHKIFGEAAATSTDYLELERLYHIEREKLISEATDKLTGSLKSLREQLSIGDMGLSLRDRRDAALDVYQPLAERVAAGDTTAYDDYANASMSLLELQREIHGSQKGYFDLFNSVKDLTNAAINSQTALASASANRDAFPFRNASAIPSNDNAQVVGAIEKLGTFIVNELGMSLFAVNKNLGTLIQQGETKPTPPESVKLYLKNGESW